MRRNLLILHSGGRDSGLLVHRALDYWQIKPILIHFTWDYPSREHELKAFRGTLPSLAHHIEVEIPMFQDKGAEEGARIVACRNQIMLSHAINYAYAMGINEIWYGACLDDNNDYVDCRPEFLAQMNVLAQTWGITIKAPRLDMSKKEIWAELNERKIDPSQFWSCYTPVNDAECGECNSCRSNDV